MRQKNDALYGEIIDFVNNYFEDNGRSPSTREIESKTGISRPTVQRYLKVLQEKGEISYDGHRGIVTEYMREMTNTNRLEMGNSIPCGALSEVSDAELEHIRFPRELSGAGDFFLLRANGDSMIKAGIDSGDLVLIRIQKTAKPGDIAAFLYDNSQTTLKRFEPHENEVWLVPENDTMSPIVIKGDDRERLMIQGVATMILKDLE